MTKTCFQIYKRSSHILSKSGSLSPQISKNENIVRRELNLPERVEEEKHHE